MNRFVVALCAGAILAGCDGENPFMDDPLVATSPVDGSQEPVDPNDPNTNVNNQFAYDPGNSITMNSVEFDDNGTPNDTTDDTLTINNIPFDGPDGQYDPITGARVTNANGISSDIFSNTNETIPGELQYFAMFVRSDHMDATSVGGRDWGNFGFAGANVNRTEFSVPGVSQESYVYAGVYAATRTYSNRGGIELIRGDATLLLDVADLDPNFPGEGLQGTIAGTITNRTRDPNGRQMVGDLPDIALRVVSFNTETGVWEAGEVATEYDNSIRDSGLHEGMIGGPDGEEMGGYLVMDGVADIQTVSFQVVSWEVTNGGTTTRGVTTGRQLADTQVLQGQVNAGTNIGLLTVDASDLPTGARILSTTVETFDITTDFDAREIGVFIGDLVPPTP